jgi:Right handed beta helix region/FlgD Ig-like domain
VAWLTAGEYNSAKFIIYCIDGTGQLIDYVEVPAKGGRSPSFYDVPVPPADVFQVAEIDARWNMVTTVSQSLRPTDHAPIIVLRLREGPVDLSPLQIPAVSSPPQATLVIATPGAQAGGGVDFVMYSSRSDFVLSAEDMIWELARWGYEVTAWASQGNPDPLIARSVAQAAWEHNLDVDHPRAPTLIILGSSYENLGDPRNIVGTIYYPDASGQCLLGTCASDAKIVDFDGDDVPDMPWTRVLGRSLLEIANATLAGVRYRQCQGIGPQRAVVLDGDVNNSPQNAGSNCSLEPQPRAALELIRSQFQEHGIQTTIYHESSYPCRDWSSHRDLMISMFTQGITELTGMGFATNRRYLPGGFIQQVYEPAFSISDVPFPQLFIAEFFACASADEDGINALPDPLLAEAFMTSDPDLYPVAVAWLGNRRGGFVHDHIAFGSRYFANRLAADGTASVQEIFFNTTRELATEDPSLKDHMLLNSAFGWPVCLPDMVNPAYISSPTSSQEIGDVVTIEGTVNPSAYSFAADLDSFTVDWGAGSSPVSWSNNGVTYLRSRITAVQQSSIATWNTGIVPAGTYALRLTAHLGADNYRVTRIVSVRHRGTSVGQSQQFTSIQSAMNWAQMGDTIRVASGTYTGNLTLKETVQLIGAPGAEIVGVGDNPVIIATNHQYPATVDSFTIRHQNPGSLNVAYGVRLVDSPIVLRNCVVRDNRAPLGPYGANVYATGKSDVYMQNCVLRDTNLGGGIVASMAFGSYGKPSITAVNCEFLSNVNTAGLHGGVALLYKSTDPLGTGDVISSFEGCSFRNNASIGGAGIRLEYTGSQKILFSNCSFVDNDGYSGGAAAIDCDNSSVEVVKCTIANTDAVNGTASAVHCLGPCTVTIRKCVIAFNDGPAVYAGTETTATMEKSVVFGNTATGSVLTDSQWASQGLEVFNENPAFCDAANGDYYLYAFSPAAAGPHFEHWIGALGVGCVPPADVVGSHQPHTPSSPNIATCPADDAAKIVVTVDFAEGVVTRDISSAELKLQPSQFTSKIFNADSVLAADSTASSGSGFRTTFTHGAFGFYGIDSVQVFLNGYPLTQKARVDVRTRESEEPFGNVGLEDLTDLMTYHWQSPPKPYSPTFDVNGDSLINLTDWTDLEAGFPAHYHHHAVDGQINSSTAVATSSAGVVLDFVEEFVTATSHRLYVDVSVENFVGVTASAISLRAGNDAWSFVEWKPSGSAPGEILFTPTIRDGAEELFFGILVSKDFASSAAPLGRLVFDVKSSDPVKITDDHFVLTVGDVLVKSGDGPAFAATMNGVVARHLGPEVARVYHNRLEQNFPNPFNPTTTIAFSLKDAGDVNLTIYDVAGRRVREVLNERRDRGAYRAPWDGRNDNGSQVASGVYFYKLVAGSFVDTKKMTLLK